MSSPAPIETEAKFRLRDSATGTRYLAQDALGEFRAASAPRTTQHEDRYLDTPDGAMARAGYAARLRQSPAGMLLTVKSLGRADSGGSIHRRDELEGPADRSTDPRSWPPSQARSLVLELCGDAALVELVTVRQLRRKREYRADQSAIEVSVDEVDVVSRGTVVDRFAEMEIELTEGDEAPLQALANLLSLDPELTASDGSKFEAAIAAARREPGSSDDRAAAAMAAVAEGAGPAVAEGAGPAVAEGAGDGADRFDETAGEVPVPEAEVLRAAVEIPAEGHLEPEAEAAGEAAIEPEAKSEMAGEAEGEAEAEAAIEPEETIEAEEAIEAEGEAEGEAEADLGAEAEADLEAEAEEVLEAEARAEAATEPMEMPEAELSPAAEEPEALAETAVEATQAAAPRAARRPAISVGKMPGVLSEDTVAEAGRKVLRFHFARMLAKEEGTREGREIEDLHQMRVATRRMRAAWRVFGDAYRPEKTRKMRVRLREIASDLGAVRDLDVLIEGLEHYRAELPEADQRALDPLVNEWHARRERARAVLVAALDADGYARFVEEFRAFVETDGAAVQPVGPTQPHRIRDTAPSRIWLAYEQVRAYEQVLRWADVPTLHELRIAAKWLRYTMEFVRETLGPEGGMLIERIVALQDHLGLLHDADVSAALAREFLVDRAGRLSEAEEVATARYLISRERELARLRRTVGPVWRGVAGLHFRRALGRTTALL